MASGHGVETMADLQGESEVALILTQTDVRHEGRGVVSHSPEAWSPKLSKWPRARTHAFSGDWTGANEDRRGYDVIGLTAGAVRTLAYWLTVCLRMIAPECTPTLSTSKSNAK
jgi:hypothetical protein